MTSLFNIAQVPFSFFGSHISISVPKGEQELFFRNHHGGGHNLFALKPLVNGTVVEPVIEAQPWLLTLRHGEGWVEICFERAGTVRMRGQGLGLQLGRKNLMYSEASSRFVINCPRTRRYQVELLQGNFTLQQLDPAEPLTSRIAVIAPDASGHWELAIDEFWSTWERPTRTASFDECLASARRAFEAFRDRMPAARPLDGVTRDLAAYVNWSCTVGAYGLFQRPVLLMSKNWMCNVWSWDQCFNALALSAGLPELALDQMLVLVDHQDAFGSYPDSINNVWKHYNFSKPPVHGWAFGEMLKRMPAPPSGAVLETMYGSLGRQANWWMKHRRQGAGVSDPQTDCSPLPYYLHGNDSGWDNSTMFAQGVPLEAPDLAALLIKQMDVLAQLAKTLGKGEESVQWKQRADALYTALVARLWRRDHFVARLANTGEIVESQSLIPWLPIILGQRLPPEIQAALKKGLEAHLTEWGLATEKVDSPRYRTDGYWQGPIWGPSTYLAVSGLDQCGFTALADTIAERFCKMCGQSGMAENFDAVSGASLCDPAYTWTASVFLLLAERMVKAC